MAGQLLLPGSRDQDVAICFQDVAMVRFGPGEAHDGAVVLTRAEGVNPPTPPGGADGSRTVWSSYQLVVLQLLGVDALRVVDGAVDLPHAHTLGSKAVQVPHGVEAHVPEALRDRRGGGGSTSSQASSQLQTSHKKRRFCCPRLVGLGSASTSPSNTDESRSSTRIQMRIM